LEVLLDAAIDEPERPAALLPLLRSAESWQVLGEGSRGAEPASAPASGNVALRFAAQAAATPEAVAVVAGGEHLSYDGLAGAAAGLAQRLEDAGVGPEQAVGVALERSPELLVTLLGV